MVESGGDGGCEHVNTQNSRTCCKRVVRPLTKESTMGQAPKELIATVQDIKYARCLAGNNKTIRDRALKSLKKWFEYRRTAQIPFNEADLMLIWKGLFYSMWMSDKPLIQEECAERISSLIHLLDVETGLQFFKAGMKTFVNEWFGIDQWRCDKFMMFVRRLLRQTFIVLKNNAFSTKLIKSFSTTLEESIFAPGPLSLQMHFCDIYMPELAKISEGNLNPNILNEFLHPFMRALSKCNEIRVVNAICDGVFRYLMRQSDVAAEHTEKFKVWKGLGFPGGKIDKLQRVECDDEDMEDEENGEENSEDDEQQTGLDPRAGHVDVILPQLKFSCKNINSLMAKYQFKATNTKTRSAIKKLINEFNELFAGDYPLGIKEVELIQNDGSTNIKKSAHKLGKFVDKLSARNKNSKTDKKRKLPEENQENAALSEPKKAKLTRTQRKPLKEEEKMNDKAEKPTKKSKLSDVEARELKKQRKLEKMREKRKKRKLREINIDETYDDAEELNELRMILQRKEKCKRKKELLEKRKQDKIKSNLLEESEDNTRKRLQANSVIVKKSGTWFVTEPEMESGSDTEGTGSPRKENVHPKLAPNTPKISPTKTISPKTSPKQFPDSSTYKKPSTPSTTDSATSTPQKNSPHAMKAFFSTNDWDTDLQDGEIELFIPSKKYLSKRKSLGIPSDLVAKSFSVIKGKNKDKRKSTDAALLNLSPGSSKKVKINLRLNQSQEAHEHEAQIKSSPGIPFDADRKPVRPVIKAGVVQSPINPFYNRRRSGLQF